MPLTSVFISPPEPFGKLTTRFSPGARDVMLEPVLVKLDSVVCGAAWKKLPVAEPTPTTVALKTGSTENAAG